jgi:hypothetical protein
MTVMWIRETMYTRYWLYELFEVSPEFQNVIRRRRWLGAFKEVCKSAAADKLTQYVTGFTLCPRTIEAGHIFHRISAT